MVAVGGGGWSLIMAGSWRGFFVMPATPWFRIAFDSWSRSIKVNWGMYHNNAGERMGWTRNKEWSFGRRAALRVKG